MKRFAYIGGMSCLIMALMVIGCQRTEPEWVSGDLAVLRSQPDARYFHADTLNWRFSRQNGSFFYLDHLSGSPLPDKGDYVVYHDAESAFFGQLVSLETAGTETGMQLAPASLNDLFEFFAHRDTLLTIGNGYTLTGDSIVSYAGDTLRIVNARRNIREGNFLRGIVEFQDISLYELGLGELSVFITPEWEGEQVTRSSLIRWDQEVAISGGLVITQFDQNPFRDSLMVRKRVYAESVEGFLVQFVVEDWLIVNWSQPNASSLNMTFSLEAESDYSASYLPDQLWSSSHATRFGHHEVDFSGWNQLESGYLNLAYATYIRPVFSGQAAMEMNKTLTLSISTQSEWPDWTLSAMIQQDFAFRSLPGIFSDVAEYADLISPDAAAIWEESGQLENHPPQAEFTVSPPNGFTDTSFKLNAGASSDREDASGDLQVRWDFDGDGAWDTGFSTTKLVTRQFFLPGTYQVRMEVLDTQGATDDTTRQVTVYQTSSAPIASFTVSPESGRQSDVFTFDASSCYDAEDPLSLLEVRWDFQNNGVWDTEFSTSKAAIWIFGQPGEYVVKLEVRDTDGLTGSTTRKVNVTSGNIKPDAFYTVNPELGTTETRFNFDASGSSDPEDDTADLLVRWDFENDGVWDSDLRTVKTITHQFLTAGTYNTLLEVFDTDGFSNTFTRSILVSNPNTPPDADFTISPSTGSTTTKFVFDASVSTDQEDELADLQVRWDWDNDDVWDTEYDTTKTTSRQFSQPGTYIVKLEVKDSGGLTDIRAKLVVVE